MKPKCVIGVGLGIEAFHGNNVLKGAGSFNTNSLAAREKG
jgi:hypothetical protein